MATFKLTPEWISNLINEVSAGNPVPFLDAIDPEVHWRIGSEKKDDVAKTGVFVSSHSKLAGHHDQFHPSRILTGASDANE